MTRVLHLLATADRRGAELFGRELAERLDGLGLRDDVLALAPARPGGAALDVEVLAGGPYRDLAALRRRAGAADVVVGHGSTGLPGGFVATLGRRPRFVYRSIGDPAAWGAASATGRAKVRLGLSGAAAVVSLWDGASEVVGATYRIGAHRRAVIPNAADPHRYAPASAEARGTARAQLDLDHGPVLAVVGALGPEKRVERAVAALHHLPAATLLVAGDGPLAAALASAARPLGRRVRLLGGLEDLRPVYAAADVVVSTSRTEGQSGALIEGRLCGLGLVATDVGGTASVVDPASGALVGPDADPREVADAVARVLALPAAARRAGRAGAVAAFGFDAVARSWATLIDRVAAPAPRRR